MIWGTFIDYKKCSIVIIPSNRWISGDFVDTMYEDHWSGFYLMHNDPQSLYLIEDGDLLHFSTLPKQ